MRALRKRAHARIEKRCMQPVVGAVLLVLDFWFCMVQVHLAFSLLGVVTQFMRLSF